jgi:hypothetical protein
MQDWIQEEAKALQLEQEAFGIEGRVPFWTAPVGLTKVEIDITHPVTDSKFEGKKVFHVFIDGEVKLWTISKRSPLYKDVIHSLVANKCVFNLMRIGSKVDDTRYQLVPL